MTYSSLRALFVKRFDIPKEPYLRKAIRSFTIAEKAVFYFFIAVFVISGIALIWRVSNAFLVDVPIRGGSLVEGVVGNPRFINPVLAITDADKNLTNLVYSGLVKLTSDLKTENDLADSIAVSDDGLIYTVHIRTNAVFHDNTPVTADDVVFTIQKIQNVALKSPLFNDWSGVTIKKVDDSTISLTLKKPYAPFINNLTVGILPKAIWKNVSDDEFSFSQFNTLPIGSGPYQVATVERDSGGIPNYYDLTPFDRHLGGAPYIEDFIFRFYSSQNDLLNAYDNGEVESMAGISPEQAVALQKNGDRVVTAPLSRVFGVFFNQNKNKALLNGAVREALDLSAPKDQIVNTIFKGYASAIDGPLPPGVFPWSGNRSTTTPQEIKTQRAVDLLKKDGWIKNSAGYLEKKTKDATIPLSFSISTGDAPELKAVADMLATAWGAIGVKVDVLVFEPGDLNQNVIRPRTFEALLFGEVVGQDLDVYPFWHSSERNDPGLNIALYVNSRVDKLLENARITQDAAEREEDYREFDQEIRADHPAVFLYAPSFLYALPSKVQNASFGSLSTPQERFESIAKWYIETNKVWTIFVK
ncbi:MAG: family 5 extracellular solute-binding protein peptide/nickel transport system substrate-binding [Parcubacteria group bacterium]|nr:family 5 extracellular solute-binding protein peptide/nickel transport system substrate-binding [Parcubacteria group bacterium]